MLKKWLFIFLISLQFSLFAQQNDFIRGFWLKKFDSDFNELAENDSVGIFQDIRLAKVVRCDSGWHVDVKNYRNPSITYQVVYRNNQGNPDSSRLIQQTEFSRKTYFHTEIPESIRIKANESNFFQDNDQYHTKYLFPKIEPLKVQFLWADYKASNTQLFIAPAFGINHYDGIMNGLAFYSHPLNKNHYDFYFVPMYSHLSKHIQGMAALTYRFYTNRNGIFSITPTLQFKKFSFNQNIFLQEYTKTKFSLSISGYFNTKNIYRIDYSFNFIKYNQPSYDTVLLKYLNVRDNDMLNNLKLTTYHNFEYSKLKNGLNLEHNKSIVKLSDAIRVIYTYSKYKKRIQLRGFGGAFLYRDELMDIPRDYRFRLSSWSGYQDYKFEHYFYNRYASHNNLFSQQLVQADGAFIIKTTLGQTWDWLAVLGADIDLPGLLPLTFYVNQGFYQNRESITPNKTMQLYESGFELSLLKNVVHLWFPLSMSEEIRRNTEIFTDNYLQKIRFSVYLNSLNPFEYSSQILKF